MTHGCYSAALLLQSILVTEMHFKTLELSRCACAALMNANFCTKISGPHGTQWCEDHPGTAEGEKCSLILMCPCKLCQAWGHFSFQW